MSGRKKRGGIFRRSLRGRAEVVQVLRDIGMSWAEVAAHFSRDSGLGNSSGGHFSSEWSRLKSEGLEVNPVEVELLRRQLLEARGSVVGWQIFGGRES